jgi:DNA helicase-2/ATP-dependent DNA helicase PcrA
MLALLKNLNEPQRAAVTTTEGPVLVVAGAGSGKTRVITHRVAYLIGEKHVRPRNILAVTFTNKAAEEMRARIYRILGTADLESWIGTFHATCAQILRREAARLGYKSNFAIYDESDQKMLVRHCMKRLSLPERDINPNAAISHISMAKNNMLTPTDLEEKALNYIDEDIARIYALYQTGLSENNAMDFDDLLSNALKVLSDFPECLEKYQSQFGHILVDEFQDTNRVQYELVSLLAAKHRNLCVVGDDDQSIYSWRGANSENLFDFLNDFPEAKSVFLEENYRSTQLILDAANSVIENNFRRKPKKLWTSNAGGEKIEWYPAPNEHAEARYIIERLQTLKTMEPDIQSSDIAVFYRTNAQSRVIEDELRDAGVMYTIVGGVSFYDRKEVKDVMAYLKIIANPIDGMSLKRIINTPPRGIGNVTLERTEQFAEQENMSLFDATGRASDIPEIRARARESLNGFYEYMSSLMRSKDDMKASELVQEVVKTSGYAQMLREDPSFQAQSRLENLDGLISAAVETANKYADSSLEVFLQSASLRAGIDEWDDTTDVVTLMTLHTAKGLEFPVVFIAGLEEELFPHLNSIRSERGIEEERRLCYVGITRAKKRVFFTSSDIRRIKGIEVKQTPSRFIGEIPDEFIESLDTFTDTDTSVEYDEYYQEMPDYENDGFHIGEIVEHAMFGSGKVNSISGSGEKMKVAVRFFRDNKQRDLLVKFAGLQRK